jgi:hypothetical protein
MMKSITIPSKMLICSGFLMLSCACAFGQAPTYMKSQVRSSNDSHLAAMAALPSGAAAPSGPVCASPPSASDLQPFGHFSQMSAQDAASLNLQFGGLGGSVNFTGQSQVIVWRQGKTFTCPSTDGKYNVIYGAEWDSAIAISQDSLTGKASFATIAANVQINNSSTTYDYVAAGYTTTSNWETANGKILQDISTNGLSVTNYATFDTDFGLTLTAASAMTPVDPPKPIGYAPIGVTDAAQSLAKGYAIMFIAKGQGCLDAKAAFPISEPWVEAIMRSVYLEMSSGKSDCDAKADPSEQPIAIQLLTGVNIKKP